MFKTGVRSTRDRVLSAGIALMLGFSAFAGVAGNAFAATEHWNDGSLSADASWDKWKDSWETTKDNYENVVMTPGKTAAEMNFAWYSHAEETPKVRISKTLNGLKSGAAFEGAQTATNVAYSSTLATELDGAEGTYLSNKVTVEGLKANTKYYYQVRQNGKWQAAASFKTGDLNNYSILYVADPQIGACKNQVDSEGNTMSGNSSGTSSYAARNDSFNWNNILNDAVAENNLSFVLSAGDQVNYANYEYEYAGFLSPAAFKNLPLAAAIGNHDSGSANYTWHYNNPNAFDVNAEDQSAYTAGHTNAGSDYYFTYGDVLYIVLDTNNYNCATHENVIKKAVDENADCKWRVVTFHQDIYGSGKDHSDSDGMVLRTQLTPIMDKYDIDVVLQGHDHTYSRTYQLTGDGEEHTAFDKTANTRSEEFQTENLCYNLASTDEDGTELVNPKGTVYFEQNSATGSKFYELIAQQQNYIAERSQTWTPTYSIVNVNGDALTITTYDAETGSILEGSAPYTIIKNADISATEVTEVDDMVCTGDELAPEPTVTLDGKELVKGTDYTVAYEDNVKPGTATMTITGIGDFSGTLTANFKITLAKPTVTALKGGKHTATATLKTVKGADGYKIYVAKSSKGSYKMVKTVTKSGTVKLTKLASGKRYVKVKAYSVAKDGTKIYSSYSTAKYVKVK